MMTGVPTYEHAFDILKKYNSDDFHLRHGQIVSGVMRAYAEEYDPINQDYWAIVGLLHDIDFELYPEQHCVRGEQILQDEGIEHSIIESCMSHGWGLSGARYEPLKHMEKILFAADELTGLIGAVAIMRPSRSLSDLGLKSVKKKFKQPSFAAGCSREVIQLGAERLQWSVDELIERTIDAMRTIENIDELI
jgi:predicted hydrolase (HD superfamily)